MRKNALRVLQVQLSSATEDFASILATSGVPSFKDAHPSDSTMLAEDVEIEYYPDARDVVNLHFRYRNFTDFDASEPANPLFRTTKIRWGSAISRKHVEKDRFGNPLVTDAGEFFEGVPQIDDARWSIEIEKNVSVVPTWVLSYLNKVNDGGVTIDNVSFGAKLLKMQQLRISESLYENNTVFRRVLFQLHYRPDGWGMELLHQGTQERVYILQDDGTELPSDPAAGAGNYVTRPVKVPFVGNDGTQMAYTNVLRKRSTKPQPLYDGTRGGEYVAGRAIEDPQGADAAWVNIKGFEVYDVADFSLLPGVS